MSAFDTMIKKPVFGKCCTDFEELPHGVIENMARRIPCGILGISSCKAQEKKTDYDFY
jgi:hypothetical protein